MRISDWSSDVCSSDLRRFNPAAGRGRAACLGRSARRAARISWRRRVQQEKHSFHFRKQRLDLWAHGSIDRKSVVQGKSVSVREDLGGRRIIKKKQTEERNTRHNVQTKKTILET